ncbi:MAG: TlpA family protein disulfide reductase [Butyrivibrio sp.]|nr:TlpA family protein disulfide reductase [Butyrivibrio sp.]
MDKEKQIKIHPSTMVLVVIAFVAGVVILDVAYQSAWRSHEKVIEALASTDVFTSFDSTTFEGTSFSKSNLKTSKITAINVWETTCPACLGEMGALEELSRSYPREDFQLIGICADVFERGGSEINQQQIEKGKELMENAKVTFPNVIPTPEMYAFFRTTIAGFPTTYFVDSEGNILRAIAGARKLDDWKKVVEEVMEGQ